MEVLARCYATGTHVFGDLEKVEEKKKTLMKKGKFLFDESVQLKIFQILLYLNTFRVLDRDFLESGFWPIGEPVDGAFA